MRALLIAASLSAAPAPAPAESLLAGTWVADLGSQQGLPTDIYIVRDGIYSCESCVPPRRYPADGRLRAVPGAANVSEAVTIVDSRTISTRIVQPDLVRITRMRVARDGRTARYVSTDRRTGIEAPLRTEYLARRASAGPAGAHAVSGTWQGIRYVSVPLQLRTTILTDGGGAFGYRTGTGYSYSAPYGGAFVPIQGPYGGSLLVSVQKARPDQVVEIRRRDGKDVQRRTYTVAPDGRRMEIATTDLATNTTFRITARRQGASNAQSAPSR